tara:strand:- start:34846 stop:35355 length:510 start_codon:yes stop_codon:yes gene_type:complete
MFAAAPTMLDAAAGSPVPDRFGPRGRFRVVHGSACDTPGGNPLVIPDLSAPPAAGQPLRVVWTMAPSAPFPSSDSAFLLVSFGDVAPVRLPASAGLPGCTLHVNPNKAALRALAPAQGSILTAEGGRVWLHWTPAAAFAGHEINCQLVVRRGGRWALSPGLEIWIGSGN